MLRTDVHAVFPTSSLMLLMPFLVACDDPAPKPARTIDLDASEYTLRAGDTSSMTLTGQDEDGLEVLVEADSWAVSSGEDCGEVLGGVFRADEVDHACAVKVDATVGQMVATTSLTVLPPVVEVRTQREGVDGEDILQVTPLAAGPSTWTYRVFSFEPQFESLEVLSADASCSLVRVFKTGLGEDPTTTGPLPQTVSFSTPNNETHIELACEGEPGGVVTLHAHREDGTTATIEAAGPS